MLNANYLALRAARRLCDQYRLQNKMLYREYCSALAKIKTAIGNGFFLNNEWALENEYIAQFRDSNNNYIAIHFQEYTEKRVFLAFKEAYTLANRLNSLCFGK